MGKSSALKAEWEQLIKITKARAFDMYHVFYSSEDAIADKHWSDPEQLKDHFEIRSMAWYPSNSKTGKKG